MPESHLSMSKARQRPISPISPKRRKENVEYEKLKREWWKPGLKCAFPGCEKNAEKQPHHSHGRSGRLLCDVRGWIPICRYHHQWIDYNRDEARRLGLLCPYGHFNDWKRMNEFYANRNDQDQNVVPERNA